MSKFKVGDKVRVREDIKQTAYASNGFKKHWIFVLRASDYAGKQFTISSVNDSPHYGSEYYLYGNSCVWTDEMFSGLATEQPRREFIVIRRSGAETIAELRHDREVIKSAKATCAPSDAFDLDTGAKLAFDRLMGREEPKPAPQPAHRFKVGDRVKTKYGIGTVVDIYDKDPHCSYTVEHDEPKNFMHDGQRGRSKKFKDEHCCWLDGKDFSPAPEPPKFYTGKVVMVDCEFPDRKHLINHLFEFKDGRQVGNKVRGMSFTYAPYKSFEQIVSYHNASTWIEVKSDV